MYLKLLEILGFFLKVVDIDQFWGFAIVEIKVQQKTQKTQIQDYIIWSKFFLLWSDQLGN